MTTSDIIALFSLIASSIAAWFAYKAWRFPTRPNSKKLPEFVGSAISDAESIADFLSENHGRIVFLSLEIDDFSEDKIDELSTLSESNLLSLRYNLGEDNFIVKYKILASENFLKKFTIFWRIEGAFVPHIYHVKDASMMEGELIYVSRKDLIEYLD